MFDNYEVTFIRVEGLGDVSTCSCKFFIDNRLCESQTVGNFERTQQVLTVPAKGLLRIRIEDQSLIASLQFLLKIIKCQGYHWLPLFTGDSDCIEEVPEEVGLPRILLIFQLRKSLAPVMEITETSEISENLDCNEFDDEDKVKVKVEELRRKIDELELELQFEKARKGERLEMVSQEIKGEIGDKGLEKERIESLGISGISAMRQGIERLEKEVEMRIRDIESRDKEIEELRTGLEEMKIEVGRVKGSRDEALENLGLKEQEILSLKSTLTKSPNLTICQSDPIQLPPINSSKPIAKLINLPDTSVNTNKSHSDLLDYYLQSSLKDLKLDGFFQKTTETFYKAGSKRVGIIYKNKNIYCKQGDSYKTLENYIFSHLTEELEKFIKKRAISRPEHKRFKSFSGSLNDVKLSECKSVKMHTPVLSSLASWKNKSITPSKGRLLSSKIGS